MSETDNPGAASRPERTYRYAEIADALRQAIADGVWAAGAVLPSESDLSGDHDASRATVRRALEELRSEGLIDSRQGYGWFVGADPVRQSLDTLDTIEHQLAAAGIDSERRVLSFGFAAPPAQIAGLLGSTPQVSDSSDVLKVERLNLANGEPFAFITVWCPATFGAGFSRNDVEQSTFHDLLRDHLGSARQTIGATAATAEVAEVLRIGVGEPLLRLFRVTTDTAGRNLLVSEHLYPAHRMEFDVTLAPNAAGTTAPALRLVE